MRRFRRFHGLGNIIMLLPVLRKLSESSGPVVLETRREWATMLSVLVPGIAFTDEASGDALDLDELTKGMVPKGHRTDEFAELLGVEGPFSPVVFEVPEAWREKFHEYSGSVVLAPEAGHDARQWPRENLRELSARLKGGPLVLIGLEGGDGLSSDHDLRGRLSIEDLIGLFSVARALITMDSGALHLAMSVELPTIAIFSGIDPGFRIRPSQRVSVLHADMDCCPCNKNETCDELYPCLARIRPELVLRKLSELGTLQGREILRV
jgi:ADP-heptose:LPS heptosyltransferase